MFDDDREVAEIGDGGGGDLQLVGVGHDVEDEVAFLEGSEHVGFGHTGVVGGRADTPEPVGAGGHLLVERLDRLGGGPGRPDAPDDGGGVPGGLRQLVFFECLGHGEGWVCGRDVHELLHVPLRGLGEIGRERRTCAPSRRCHPC